MGPKQSNQVQVKQSAINHPKFENAKFLKNEKNGEYIQIKSVVANQNEYITWTDKLKGITADKS